MQQLFPNRSTVKVRALFLGGRLELKGLESSRVLAALPLMISAGEQGYAELFRYGAVVLFNVSPVEEMSILHHLRPLLRDPFETPDTEVTEITVDPDKDERVDNNIIIVKDTSPERLQVVADIFAKSVVLDHYEQRVAGAFDRIEPLADHLQRHGRTEYRDTELLRHIGGTLLIQHTTVGRVEVGEKPEILWERPDLERLYVRLEDEYELRERHVALERKLDLLSRTAETLLNLMQHKRSLRVEWYIVILIMAEIALSLIDKFLLRCSLRLRRVSGVALGRHDEIVGVQSFDLVRVEHDGAIAPAEGDVGMMTFRLGKGPDPVHVGEGFGEILEFVGALYAAGVRQQLPLRHFAQQAFRFDARKRCDAAAAGYAVLLGERHSKLLIERAVRPEPVAGIFSLHLKHSVPDGAVPTDRGRRCHHSVPGGRHDSALRSSLPHPPAASHHLRHPDQHASARKRRRPGHCRHDRDTPSDGAHRIRRRQHRIRQSAHDGGRCAAAAGSGRRQMDNRPHHRQRYSR